MLIDHEEYQLPDVHYVPATIYYQSYGGLGIYVKWKGHGGHGCKVISQSGWNTHLLCPDREIFMVGNLNKLSNDLSLGDWDEFVPVSLFHDMPQAKAQRGPEIFMVNAHQDKGREHVRHNTRSRPPMPTARKILGDSGAFQMRTPGVFVDPATVRHFYNHNVDYGVVLDFPLWDGWHYDNLIRSAHIQARNTDIIMEGLYPHVNLVNVVHGMRPKDRMDFLEIVHRPEITSFSTSNYGFGEGIVAFVYQMKALWDSTEERYPGHYQHFHLLAMSESKLMFVLARMAATGLLGQLKITFDSSTHLHSANAKSFLHTNSGMQSLKRIGLGDDLNLFNSNQRLPCDCPVCGAVGWTDALNLSSMSGVSFFLSMHNVYATDQHFKSLLWYAQHKSLEDLIFLTGKLFPQSANAKIHDEVVAALRYIERIKDAGFEEANREFGFFIDYAFDDDDQPPIEQEQSMFASAPVVDAEIALAYEKADEKPWSEIDVERMTEFENKIAAMSLGIRNFDSQKAIAKKRAKSRIKGPALSGESDLTQEAKQMKRDKKKPEIAQKERKVTVATSARSASSFSKQKSKAKAAGKPKAELKVRGKKVIKSENRKRL